jgi:hypothetical protein
MAIFGKGSSPGRGKRDFEESARFAEVEESGALSEGLADSRLFP